MPGYRPINFYGQIRFGLILLLSFTMFSCVKESGTDEVKQVGSMTLNVSCSDMTRATEPGSNDFKENLLLTLDIFYYRTSSDENCFEYDRVTHSYQGSATYTKKLEILTKEKFFGTGETGSCYVYVIANGPRTKIDSLLNRNIASVANLMQIVLASPDLGNSEVNPDMGSKLVRQNYFVMDGGATMTYSNGSASVDVKLARSLSKIQLYVHFADTVYVNGKAYMPSIISVNSTSKKAWGKAVFSNGLMRGYINDSDTSNAYSPSAADYYPASGLTYDEKARYIRQDTLAISRDSTTYYSHSPFYTYPMTWEMFKSNVDTRPTTLMLVVDWYTKESGGMTAKTTFYSIDVNSSQASGEVYKFKRNTFYKLYVDVKTIGSDTSTDPIEIKGECEIIDWNHVNQESSIENLRYLVVEKNYYVLDNEETLYIPYSTSHKCKISMVRVWKNNLSKNFVTIDSLVRKTSTLSSGLDISGYDPLSEYVVDTLPTGGDDRPYAFRLTDNRIIFHHKLINRRSENDSDFDYVPFEIEFKIEHFDNSNYCDTIYIIQHPELSVQAEINSDYHSDSQTNNDNSHAGCIYVNGFNPVLGEGNAIYPNSYSNPTEYYTWDIPNITSTKTIYSLPNTNSTVRGGAYGLSYQDSGTNSDPKIIVDCQLNDVLGLETSNQNSNPNRYIIRTSVSGSASNYVIGDPRTDTVSLFLTDENEEWSKYAPSVDEEGNVDYVNNRRLEHYYPTRGRQAFPDSKYVLSPRFMVASSYGVTRPLTKDNAIRRCASYQEDGYPAGRWRIPSAAEVGFCIQLTNKKMIPRLFGSSYYSTSYYWTATGYVTVNNRNGTETFTNDNDNTGYSIQGYYGDNLAWVRCVYDVWYWGEDMPLEKETFTNGRGITVTCYRFTWGDMPE
jgi:hypothetical protein